MAISFYRSPIHTAVSRKSASRPSKTPSQARLTNERSSWQAIRLKAPPIIHLTLTLCATAIVLALLVPAGERRFDMATEATVTAQTCVNRTCDSGGLLLIKDASPADTVAPPGLPEDGL